MSLAIHLVGHASLWRQIEGLLKPWPHTSHYSQNQVALHQLMSAPQFPTEQIILGALNDPDLIVQLQQRCQAAVIVLSAQPTVDEAVRLMQAGAIDYIPVSEISTERLARALQQITTHYANQHRIDETIQALMAQLQAFQQVQGLMPTLVSPLTQASTSNNGATHVVRELHIDHNIMQASYRGQMLDLSPTEFDILYHLMRAEGQVVSLEELAAAIQGVAVDRHQARKMLSAHISNLRAKMKKAHCDSYLVNRRGIGYYISADTEEALRAVEAELHLIAENTLDIIIHCDAAGIIRYITPSVERVTGYPQNHFLDQPIATWLVLVHPEDREAARVALTQWQAAATPTDTFRLFTQADDIIWFEAVCAGSQADDMPNGVIAVMRDVSERKARETEQYQRMRDFQTLVEASPDVIVRFDRALRLVYANPKGIETTWQLTGIQDVRGKLLSEIIPAGQTLDEWQQCLEQVMASGEHRMVEFFVPSERSARYLRVRFVPETTSHGQIETVMVIAHDITQLKQTEAELRQREATFRTMIEHVPLMISRFDRDLRYVYVNPAVSVITGVPQSAFIGRCQRELGMNPEDAAFWDEQLSAVFQSGEPKRLSYTGLANEQAFEMVWYLLPEFDDQGNVITVMSLGMEQTGQTMIEELLKSAATGFGSFATTDSKPTS